MSECTSANIYIQYESILKEEIDTTPTFSLKQGLFTVRLAQQHVSLLTSDHSQSIFLCINWDSSCPMALRGIGLLWESQMSVGPTRGQHTHQQQFAGSSRLTLQWCLMAAVTNLLKILSLGCFFEMLSWWHLQRRSVVEYFALSSFVCFKCEVFPSRTRAVFSAVLFVCHF